MPPSTGQPPGLAPLCETLCAGDGIAPWCSELAAGRGQVLACSFSLKWALGPGAHTEVSLGPGEVLGGPAGASKALPVTRSGARSGQQP